PPFLRDRGSALAARHRPADPRGFRGRAPTRRYPWAPGRRCGARRDAPRGVRAQARARAADRVRGRRMIGTAHGCVVCRGQDAAVWRLLARRISMGAREPVAEFPVRYAKAETVLRLALDMQGTREGLTLEDIRDRYGVSRRTAERMRDAA